MNNFKKNLVYCYFYHYFSDKYLLKLNMGDFSVSHFRSIYF